MGTGFFSGAAEKARAKFNLSLAVLGKRADGFHILDSAVAELDGLFDDVKVSAREDGNVTVRYAGGETFPNDNALRAAQAIINEFGTPGVDIEIVKCIPVGAGLGGSSADAAAVARAMGKIFGLGQIPSEFLVKLGSDVPAMYAGGSLRMKGSGENLSRIEVPARFAAVLVKEGLCSDTSKVFAEYDRLGETARGEGSIDGFLNGGEAFNDLETACFSLYPEVGNSKILMESCGFQNVVMTGSGAGIAGFSQDETAFRRAVARVGEAIAGKNYLLYAYPLRTVERRDL